MGAVVGIALALTGPASVGCGEDEPPLDDEIPLNEVVTGPVPSGVVEFAGKADPAGGNGFIFSQASVSVFVAAPQDVSRRIDAGEDVRVEATVKRMDRRQARRLRAALPDSFGDSPNVELRAVVDTRIAPGAAYLDLIEIHGEEGT